jgi:hypothetical protein
MQAQADKPTGMMFDARVLLSVLAHCTGTAAAHADPSLRPWTTRGASHPVRVWCHKATARAARLAGGPGRVGGYYRGWGGY